MFFCWLVKVGRADVLLFEASGLVALLIAPCYCRNCGDTNVCEGHPGTQHSNLCVKDVRAWCMKGTRNRVTEEGECLGECRGQLHARFLERRPSWGKRWGE